MARYAMIHVLAVLLLTALSLSPMITSAASRTVSIIPKPVQMEVQDGNFRLTPATVIVASKDAAFEGRQLASLLWPATGLALQVVEKAKTGHDVVMAPTDYTYFDYYQSKDVDKEPLAIGGYVPLEVVYNYEPVPKEIPAEYAKHVLGAQGQLWTEYMPTPKQVEYMAFPRLTALAEVTWTPREGKDYQEFLERLSARLKRLGILHVNCRPLGN